jgi:hypothetical protein
VQGRFRQEVVKSKEGSRVVDVLLGELSQCESICLECSMHQLWASLEGLDFVGREPEILLVLG